MYIKIISHLANKVIRNGNLKDFFNVVEYHAKTFKKDKNYLLVTRLRRNVIMTNLKKINLAYSRISLQDMSDKINLEDTKDLKFIITKVSKYL